MTKHHKKIQTKKKCKNVLIFSTSDNSGNKSQQTVAPNSVSLYIISEIYSTEAVVTRLWFHLRTWNVDLIHSHYFPELILEPLRHINQRKCHHRSSQNFILIPINQSPPLRVLPLESDEEFQQQSCSFKKKEEEEKLRLSWNLWLETGSVASWNLPFCLRLCGRATLRLGSKKLTLFFH